MLKKTKGSLNKRQSSSGEDAVATVPEERDGVESQALEDGSGVAAGAQTAQAETGYPQDSPTVVSKRNHFHSAAGLAEDHMRWLPDHMRTLAVRQWLEEVIKQVVHSVSWNFKTAAERGIDQAATLMCDPDYYVTLKDRRKREAERQKEYDRQQKQEMLERRLAPTGQQIEAEMESLEGWIQQEESHLLAMRARMEQLKSMVPKNVRITTTRDWKITGMGETKTVKTPISEPVYVFLSSGESADDRNGPCAASAPATTTDTEH